MPPMRLQRMMKTSIQPYAEFEADVTALAFQDLIVGAIASFIPIPPLGCCVLYCGYSTEQVPVTFSHLRLSGLHR